MFRAVGRQRTYLRSKADLEQLKLFGEPGAVLHRRRGLSTAMALEAMAHAIRNPGVTIPIRDHLANRQAGTNLLRLIAKIIEDSDLHGFEASFETAELRFNVDET